jgi:tetratricopeptide (TPR) repeat protein
MKMKKCNWDRVIGFFFVFLFVLIVYVRTMAASVSFWDCGEFIACAHILGIPHPPGAPLYGMLGRLFSLLPLFETVARRVNFLSALSGALAAGMLFLVVERISRIWFDHEAGWKGRLLGIAGGVTAGLWMAFSDTYWSNTIEAEVYAPATFLMVLAIWLGLVWREMRGAAGGDHTLLLLVYLLFLGIGIHLTAFMMMPALFLFVILVDHQRLRDWRFWLACAALGMVVASLGQPFLIASGAALVLAAAGMHLGSSPGRRRWRFCFWMVALGLLGYSVQAFIPLRSLLDPIIDENDPDTWKSFMYYLERKQYGQESMLKLMLRRKGSWINQFGVHQRMGFWGFFRQGWAPAGWWPVVLGIGLVGMVAGWFRERKIWWYLFVLMILCSLVIVLWMNFSDGTRGIQLEVRDRDYFFTPTYVLFSLWMGLGASALLWSVRRMKGVAGGVVFTVLLAALLAGPVGTLAYNYHRHDRSRNWIAHDYGYNLLNSCDPDALLFTNGDNDTFPLWYLQEVEGLRKDVRVVNLSLLNTPWYIKQLKDMAPQVPIGLSDDQIDRLAALRLKDGRILRIQDQMIQQIVQTNQWQRPIFFAVTVPEENRAGLDEYLLMEAMVYRLLPEKRTQVMDVDRTRHNLNEVYRYGSMGDPTVEKDENTRRLLFNLSSAFISLANEFYNQGRLEDAEAQLRLATEVLGGDWRPYAFLADILGKRGDYTTAVEQLEKAVSLSPDYHVLYRMLGNYRLRIGQDVEALADYERAYRLSPSSRHILLELAELYVKSDQVENARDLLLDWLGQHPDDSTARDLLAQISRGPILEEQ